MADSSITPRTPGVKERRERGRTMEGKREIERGKGRGELKGKRNEGASVPRSISRLGVSLEKS